MRQRRNQSQNVSHWPTVGVRDQLPLASAIGRSSRFSFTSKSPRGDFWSALGSLNKVRPCCKAFRRDLTELDLFFCWKMNGADLKVSDSLVAITTAAFWMKFNQKFKVQSSSMKREYNLKVRSTARVKYSKASTWGERRMKREYF